MWEPFAEWVSTNYPKDAAVMYNDSLSDFRLTEESIRLWDQRIKEYVTMVQGPTEIDIVSSLTRHPCHHRRPQVRAGA